MIVPPSKLVRIVLVTGAILLVPLVAMQFTDDVVWTPFDFLAASVLLGGTGLLYELAVGAAKTSAYRLAAGAAVATGFLLTWSNLAVGLIGNENNPVNLLYFGVVAVAVVGAVRARLEATGMARAMLVTALAQAMVPAVAIPAWQPPAATDVFEVLGVTAFFVFLWVGSAFLFLRAAPKRASA